MSAASVSQRHSTSELERSPKRYKVSDLRRYFVPTEPRHQHDDHKLHQALVMLPLELREVVRQYLWVRPKHPISAFFDDGKVYLDSQVFTYRSDLPPAQAFQALVQPVHCEVALRYRFRDLKLGLSRHITFPEDLVRWLGTNPRRFRAYGLWLYHSPRWGWVSLEAECTDPACPWS